VTKKDDIFDNIIIPFPAFEFPMTLGDYKAVLSHYANKYMT